MCHVILTTPTLGTVSHQKANTSGGQLVCGGIDKGLLLSVSEKIF